VLAAGLPDFAAARAYYAASALLLAAGKTFRSHRGVVALIHRTGSKLKTALRKAKARTRVALDTVVAGALATVGAPDAWDWAVERPQDRVMATSCSMASGAIRWSGTGGGMATVMRSAFNPCIP
jgi:hypothetical protein